METVEYIVIETPKAQFHVSIFPLLSARRLMASCYGYSPKLNADDRLAQTGEAHEVWKDYREGTDAKALLDACMTDIEQRFGPINRMRSRSGLADRGAIAAVS